MNEAISDEFYIIVTNKSTECKGLHDELQCVSVCPVLDEDNEETEDQLLAKNLGSTENNF
ncbi:hypothetical protein [Lutibacter sp.]